MHVIPPPPPADRPASGPYPAIPRGVLPYGEVFVAMALLLIVLITT